ncbi:MAG: helix-turn-helix domain-containing protein [Chitinophagaceae bacterium]|nr:helix-turn-helix domain-containing protein [Chitinophagaceae bacterium]
MKDKCGISSNTWSNYENNVSRPDLDKIIELSKIFGVNLDDLLLKDLEQNRNNAAPDENRPPMLQEEDNTLTVWILLGQLKQMDAKLDRLLLLKDEPEKK